LKDLVGFLTPDNSSPFEERKGFGSVGAFGGNHFDRAQAGNLQTRHTPGRHTVGLGSLSPAGSSCERQIARVALTRSQTAR
jgi:hypothetical protein